MGDVNGGDGFQDAVITYFVEDTQAESEFGKSSVYDTWKIALFINEQNTLTISDNVPFSDLVPVSTFGFDEYKMKSLKEDTFQIDYLRDRSYDTDYDRTKGVHELIPIEIPIVKGKFIAPKK